MIPSCLSLDYGIERVGTAVNVGELVLPGETVAADKFDVWYASDSPVHEFLVVGVPLDLKGQLSIAANRVIAFAEALKLRDGVRLRYVDERLTTVLAQKRLRAAGKNTRTAKSLVDSVSAAVILETAIGINSLTPGKDLDEL